MTKSEIQRQELYQIISLARAQRDRTSRIEGIVGNILFTILGGCVLFTIALWLTR